MNIFSIVIAILNLISNPPDVQPVDNFNMTQYTGTWYQMYDNTYNKIFIANGSCIHHHFIADINPLYHMSYINLSPYSKNSFERKSGTVLLNGTMGSLKLQMDDATFGIDYYVTKLGPIINDKYDYAIVTDPLMLSLYVLARNKETFHPNYEKEINEFLDQSCPTDKVIDYLTKPIKVDHDC